MKGFWIIILLFDGCVVLWGQKSEDLVIINNHHYHHHHLRLDDEFECQSGLCIPEGTCIRQGGEVIHMSQCPYPSMSCCHFPETSCRGGSSNLESFWKSPYYPAPIIGTILCQYDVQLQPGVCGVRLDFKEFNSSRPLDRGLCHMDQFLILNSLDGPAFPRCGELSGYSTIVPVNSRVPLTLLAIVQSSMETVKWNIHIKQLKCNLTPRIQDYPGCGRKVNSTNSGSGVGDNRENLIATENEGSMNLKETKEGRLESPENYFYIQYLKRAHEAVLESASNPNNTFCKNTASDVAAEKLKERIIRGEDALLHEFPWQVSIQDDKGHICGGAILSPRVILTAAHCFISLAPVKLRRIRIVVGDLDLNSTTETDHVQLDLHSVLFHAHFDPYYLKNDIAIIRIRGSIRLRQGIEPVCLPEAGNSFAGSSAVISGWGAVHFPMGRLATHLQRVDNRVIENDDCQKRLKVDYIFSTMLCAVAPNCSGTCFGDSGGSLVTEASSGIRRVIGIVSFGIGGCALLPYWPDVYTRVSEYLDWLSYATLPF